MEQTHAGEPVLLRYRTREIRTADLEAIQGVLEAHRGQRRSAIARQLCALWEWRDPRGDWKLGACLDLLRHLERQGLIALPPPRAHTGGRKNWRQHRPLSEHPLPVYPLSDGARETLIRSLFASSRGKSGWAGRSWSTASTTSGHRPIVGEHLRYAAYLEGQIVACLAWASAALRCPARDRFIGWDDATRKRRLPGVVNNTRFLILPWIRVPHLASKILATNLRRLDTRLAADLGPRLVLAETFVDAARFQGTCYRAANWIEVGITQGRGKKGNRYHHHGRPKTVWLYPLHRHWQQRLTAAAAFRLHLPRRQRDPIRRRCLPTRHLGGDP